MKRTSILVLIVICVVTAFLIFRRLIPHKQQAFVPVSTRQAEILAAAWHRDEWYGCPRLTEVTTKEIRDRLHAQVFKRVDHGCNTLCAYLIKDRKVYPMDNGYGGHHLGEMAVCDITGDSKEELIYTSRSGSGILRSVVEVYRFDAPNPVRIPSSFALAEADITFKKQAGKLDLHLHGLYMGKAHKMRLGQLIIVRRHWKNCTDVKLDPNLPKEWKERVWR